MGASGINSDVGVCNLALMELKQSPIASIDTPVSTAESLCAIAYHHMRRATLRSHPWNFAIKRVKLSTSASFTPAFGYTNAYLLPNDFLRYVSRHDDLGVHLNLSDEEYQLEDGYLLYDGTSGSVMNVRYIYDHVVPAKWDDLFIELLSLNLALKLSANFSTRENRIQAINDKRVEIQNLAAAIDGQERPPTRIQRSKFIQARRQGSRVASAYTRFDG